jgi:hypothetical protein
VNSNSLIPLFTIIETIYARIPPAISFIMPKSKAYKYLPITNSALPKGKIPYSLLKLFFSDMEKTKLLKTVENIITMTIVNGGCVNIAKKIART